ncbi:DUF4031 domain-containing protein [Burkholderia glumae]|uniref:DUF4031 domain-containing protein n=1 Tax=Burkholderia glumae TaxID=337 RepID=UPI0020CE47AE|nr:DUF4031 domain-containing protein [Burkholderia glumae]MCQ0031499.1 DUF4031 domain-containing protein [Burkholderia glumae]MCQ0035151.1 DUF4031 domain-containing protein [Burkholderia glumae]MCR1769798.1 DUF4031 domain-containing protein [Burkholderia glumae]UVT00088.1 DUF4031 domain-containing protein [Burkholderia glumae]
MTVYVDDMYRHAVWRQGPRKTSHLFADSTAELIAMSASIGVDPKSIQNLGEDGEHIEVADSERAAALAAGAVAVTLRQSAAMNTRRSFTGSLGLPADALEWLAALAQSDNGADGANSNQVPSESHAGVRP